ncbi:MAG: hypothetical protein RDU20_06400 [Desulfomonilaceae bacterium]|nr:hypothetical protein [Desulfomonilaceae bacterium]
MNIFDSIRPLRRMLGVPGQVIRETTCKTSRGSTWKPASFRALSCWALIVSISLLMVSGCGRYKEEIENAKQQIDKLNAQVKQLTEEAARLNQDKSRLSDQVKTLSEKNERIQQELEDLNKTKAALAAENKELKKKTGSAEDEIASLKREKSRLAKEVDELKKRPDILVPPPKSPAPSPDETGPPSAEQQQELTPCDQVMAFMKASEAIVRTQKGEERVKSLEQLREQYAPRMKGAPEKAIRAAEDWVKEGTKFWDEPDDDSTFRALRLRNTVLESCGKSPEEAGLK